jgi:hypothetical protein
MWAIVFAVLSLVLIGVVLLDGFETMVLPRRVLHGFRPARTFYRSLWWLWRHVAARLPAGRYRQAFLGVFGPLSLLVLFTLWVAGLITGFGLLHWSLGTATAPGEPDLLTYWYYSGTTFLTLGYGDLVPVGPLGRVLAVTEAGLGFGFMAVIIGYLPALYQAFSQRELAISLLDARAGSPPTAAQGLLRAAHFGPLEGLATLLAEWERWAAQLLESHLSYPVLAFYRSQHDNQSWVGALTAVLDTCALLMAGVKGVQLYQTQLTFAMARHAAVDLALVFRTPPLPPEPERLTAGQLADLREQLRQAGLELREGPAFEKKLAELRGMYEPFVNGLGRYFWLALPPVVPERAVVDNWQTSAWMRRTAGRAPMPAVDGDEHFD